MNDTPESLARQIADVEHDLTQPLSPRTKATLEQELAALRQQHAALLNLSGAQIGDARFGDMAGGNLDKHTQGKVDVPGEVRGAAVGVNQGTIQIFFGSAGISNPADAQRALVQHYLARVVETCDRLRLSGLVQRERRDASPALTLSHVYVVLAAETWERVDAAERADTFADALTAGDPAVVLPEATRRVIELPREVDPRHTAKQPAAPRFRLERPLLLTEALSRHRQVVLLGGPGSGKSSFVRHLAVALAHGEDAQPPTLPGWRAGWLLPLYAALGEFAAWTQQPGGTLDGPGLWRYLLAQAQAYGLTGLDEPLSQAFNKGGLLVLLDGLDEVADPSLRVGVARAVAKLAEAGGRVVVTCRVRSFDQAVAAPFASWTPPVTLAPFALGQMRHFVAGWYARSADQGVIVADEATRRVTELTDRLAHLHSLRDLGQTPLLLTMITLLHFYEGKLPEDRADLYEDLVELWLNRWRVRSNEPGAPLPLLAKLKADKSLGFLKDYHLRNTLERLAYDAHQNTLAHDGRGLLHRHLVRGAFEDLFAQFEIGPGLAAEKATLVLEHLECESGLLLSEGGDLYGVPHLSYEEYLAGCHLGQQATFHALAYAHWQRDPGRWREVIFLALGRMVRGTGRETAAGWLAFLLSAAHGDRVRGAAERQPAAVFAAECLEQMGGKAALIGVTTVGLPELWQTLVASLAEVIEGNVLPVAERIRAGSVLGDLDDPRIPVTPDDWRRELGRRSEGFTVAGDHYWRYVRPETYQIGGWNKGEPSAKITLPAFWLARFPLTVAQYAPFVAEGYGKDAERWWTPEGWMWKQANQRTEPWGWDKPEYRGTNQPVIGVAWYEVTAFCAWLSERLQGALPVGYLVRLPTEAEWEATAAYDAQMQRRPYPWGDAEPTPERAIYDESNLGRPAPVGCCPSGAAACGAMDMVGNVWEWIASSHKGYPAQSGVVGKGFTTDDYDVPLRGASWYDNRTNVRCGARFRNYPDFDFDLYFGRGVRVCVSPRSR
ncbi:SUMF1/EgtB/PvdO family nonheme iron enzyme [Chloroflexales bacterium ZM16-3]|nr:SUMF1/EgtB/PvdO family nonheme iron enzyme [Chloroflexales bacterium ZM16-3]